MNQNQSRIVKFNFDSIQQSRSIDPETRKSSDASVDEINPSSFSRKTVFVSISNPRTKETVLENLELSGGIIVQNFSPLVNYVISDKPFKVQRPPNFRGAQLIKASKKTISEPVVILSRQIPWAFRKIEGAPSSPIFHETNSIKPMIVIAHGLGRFQPKQKMLPRLLKIYFPEQKIRGLFCNPFSPLPQNLSEYVKKMNELATEASKMKSHPPDKGYCEICQLEFQNAEEHRNSKRHQNCSSEAKWKLFDSIAKELMNIMPPIAEYI